MNHEGTIGMQIGTEAAEHGERHAAEFCSHERQRIEAANQPIIMALRAKIALLQDRDKDLTERIANALPPGEAKERKQKAFGHWAIAVLLSIASYIFAVLALEPYRLGWKAWLYCLGAAIVAPFLVDRVLQRYRSEKLIGVVESVACIAALASLMLFAVIRGDLLAQEVGNDTPAVVIESDSPVPPPQTDNSFYKETLWLLRVIMAGLALAMEAGAGCAVHEAQRWGGASEEVTELRADQTDVRQQVIAAVEELRLKETEGQHHEEEFWRDFARSMLNGAKATAQRYAALLLFSLVVFSSANARAAERLNIVVAVDLTASVDATGPDGKAEFDKNVGAVSRLLGVLPAGSKLTVIGITERSFSQPYILLSAELSPDPGYFRERLASGRSQLLKAWQEKSKHLALHSRETDLCGALIVASQLLPPDGRKNLLVIYSDMRHYTKALDLEHPDMINAKRLLSRVEKDHLIPSLKGVDVYVLGVDAADRTIGYWQGLREFWTAYFEESGAVLKSYSLLRQLPDLAVEASAKHP